jgi:hypothetical protein
MLEGPDKRCELNRSNGTALKTDLLGRGRLDGSYLHRYGNKTVGLTLQSWIMN